MGYALPNDVVIEYQANDASWKPVKADGAKPSLVANTNNSFFKHPGKQVAAGELECYLGVNA